MNSTFTLEEIGLRDAPQVGEEAASLGEILKIGAPIPTAFVIPTTSYAEYLNYPDVKSALCEYDPANPEELKRRLLAASLPEILEESLRSSYRTLSGPRNTFVSVRAGGSEQRALGEEELIHSVKKLWAEHLARLHPLEENLSTNPLPILVQQIEVKDLGGRLLTSDPYLADSGTVVVEVDHHGGKERLFFEKGTDRLISEVRPRKEGSRAKRGVLTKRLVTGLVKEELSPDFVLSLSSWATKIERLLGSPQELGWSSYQGTLAFLWVKPLHLRERVPAVTKLWVRTDDPKEAIPSGAKGIIATTTDNAVKLAREFPTKLVLLALETIDEDKLTAISRAKHKERQKNLHLIFPPVRTVSGLREMKKVLAGEGLPRGSRLRLYFRTAFPTNVVLLDRFLELEVDGVVFDAKSLTQGFLGTWRPVEPDDSLLWALNKVQQGCKKAGLELLYLSDNLNEELLANLIRRGVTQIAVDVANEEALLATLATVEGRVLEESDRV